MAGRQTRTPGAEAPKETTTTAAQADAALEEILGTPDVKDAEPKTEEGALIPVEQFDAVAQELAETKAKLAALEKQSKATTKSSQKPPVLQQSASSSVGSPRRTRDVVTEKGWSKEEY